MKLLVISHTAHYEREGQIVGWGGTVREIDELSEEFEDVRHVAFLHSGEAPRSAIPYGSSRVRLVPVPPSGGSLLVQKLGILAAAPRYVWTIFRELRSADCVHVRCPANVSMIALVVLLFMRQPQRRWVKYAGSWRPYVGEPRSYAIQRWWIRRGLHRGVATVNGRWTGDPPHVHAFLNPCLTHDQLEQGREAGERKILASPVRLLFVGRLEERKGPKEVVEVLGVLRRSKVDARLDIVGDGPDRPELQAIVHELNMKDHVSFHGWLPRQKLDPLYADAHFILLPSQAEGWPKVLSEAMAFGVVPLAAGLSSIPQYLEAFGCGRALDPSRPYAYAEAILDYLNRTDHWKRESRLALEAATMFSFERYRAAVRRLLELPRRADRAIHETRTDDRGATLLDAVSPLWR